MKSGVVTLSNKLHEGIGEELAEPSEEALALKQMRNTERVIAWLGALQILAVLLGHACGVAGNSWVVKVHAVPPDYAPPLTYFYMHHGLWLLLAPLAWFGLSLSRLKSESNPSNGWLWLGVGIAMLLILIMFGIGAILAPMIHVSGLGPT